MILWEDYYSRQCVHGRYALRCRICCAHLARRRDRGPAWPVVAAAVLWLLVLPFLAARALEQEAQQPLKTLNQRLGATDR